MQWEGYSVEGATWITLDEFKMVYPDFQLANELFQGGGVSVMDYCYGRMFGHRNKQGKSQLIKAAESLTRRESPEGGDI